MSRGTGTVAHPVPCDISPEEPAVPHEQDDHFIGRRFQQLDRGETVLFGPWAAALCNIHGKQNRSTRFGAGWSCTKGASTPSSRPHPRQGGCCARDRGGMAPAP